ncbi:MAG: hypothetical protein QOE65_317 [Solirubrobacteraceae bacterium]|jgi:hypothetical protein|nr:hypothetical protein [Solirubrobacteraceae bacterium]
MRKAIVIGLAALGLALVPASAPAAVRSCSAAVDFNLRITSARNMTCGAAKFDMKRYRGSIRYRFTTPGGFVCTRSSGTSTSGTWRCAKGTRAYRFAFSD